MTDDLNIKILEQKGFKKIKLIDTGSAYDFFYTCFINKFNFRKSSRF